MSVAEVDPVVGRTIQALVGGVPREVKTGTSRWWVKGFSSKEFHF